MQEVRGIFKACMMTMMMVMGIVRTLEAGGREAREWVLGCGFSTYSLWSRSVGLCFGGLVPLSRGLPHLGGTGAPCPPH